MKRELHIERDETLTDWTYEHAGDQKKQHIALGFPDTPDGCRRAGAWAMQLAQKYKATHVTLTLTKHHSRALAEGVQLGSYAFDIYKEHERTVDEIHFTQGEEKELDLGMLFGEATNYARDLINTPANDMNSKALIAAAKNIPGVKVTVRDKAWLKKRGMGGILAVNQGSANKPALIELSYGPKKDHVALVGKGVTYDSGGINIKLEALEYMKADMGGAAAVLAVMRAAAQLKLKTGLRGYIPVVENMLGASAQRTGDIITSYAGKTVEIMNTDAEGRVILADALTYAQEFKPKEIIDFATLTGACIVALGHEAAGAYGDNELCLDLMDAGEKTGDLCWQLPLLEEFDRHMDSPIADVSNAGKNKLIGGSIQAAAFLQRFINPGQRWAHLDIAGTAFRKTKPLVQPHYQSQGANGGGVRCVLEYLRSQE